MKFENVILTIELTLKQQSNIASKAATGHVKIHSDTE